MVNYTPAEGATVIGDRRVPDDAYDVDDNNEEENSPGYDEEESRDDGYSAADEEHYDDDVGYPTEQETSYKSYYQDTYSTPEKTVNVTYEVDPAKYPDTGSRLRRSMYYEDGHPRYPVRTHYASAPMDVNEIKSPSINLAQKRSQSPTPVAYRPMSPQVKPETGPAIPLPDIPASRTYSRRGSSLASVPKMMGNRSSDMRDPSKAEASETHESSLRNPEEANRNLRKQSTTEAADEQEYRTGAAHRAMRIAPSRRARSSYVLGASAPRPRPALPPPPSLSADALRTRRPLKYSYVPAWALLARRNHRFFLQVLDYYFAHAHWPDFEKLPDNFRALCLRNDIGRNHAKRMPGFAPIWMFVLRKLDERYFLAAVDYFFEQRMLPSWDWLPKKFVQKFQELGLHQRQYYA